MSKNSPAVVAIETQSLEFAPSTKKVANGRGRKIEVAFDPSTGGVQIGKNSLSAAAIGYLVFYGAKQSLADSYASATTQAEFDALFDKRLDKIIAGTMSIRSGGAPRDPFEAECIKIAIARLRAIAAKKNKPLPKATSDKFKALVEAYRNGPKKEEIEIEARRRLDVVNDESDDGIDFDDLLADANDETDSTNDDADESDDESSDD